MGNLIIPFTLGANDEFKDAVSCIVPLDHPKMNVELWEDDELTRLRKECKVPRAQPVVGTVEVGLPGLKWQFVNSC